jgi:hypothetical protein
MLESLKARALIRQLLVLAAIQLFTVTAALAQSLTSAPQIFDVRISLPLEPEDEAYHDFYINAGPEAGFKKGMFVTVVRLVPVHDPIQNKQQATLTVDVARLQVIHVERNITVARLDLEFTDEDRPTLEYESVMIGDRIDPASFTMDVPKKKQKIKKKVAAEDLPRPIETAREDIKPDTSAAVAAAVKAVVPASATAPPPNAVAASGSFAASASTPVSGVPVTPSAAAPQTPADESASANKPSAPASVPVPAPASSNGASNAAPAPMAPEMAPAPSLDSKSST